MALATHLTEMRPHKNDQLDNTDRDEKVSDEKSNLQVNVPPKSSQFSQSIDEVEYDKEATRSGHEIPSDQWVEQANKANDVDALGRVQACGNDDCRHNGVPGVIKNGFHATAIEKRNDGTRSCAHSMVSLAYLWCSQRRHIEVAPSSYR